jgi:hypothetical protein
MKSDDHYKLQEAKELLKRCLRQLDCDHYELIYDVEEFLR